jgi:Protein of unknown function (DUF2510)
MNRVRRIVQGWEQWVEDRFHRRARPEISDSAPPAAHARGPEGTPPAGWYDDPTLQGVRRYWNGTAWTDSRVTTEGIAYRLQEHERTRSGPGCVGLVLSGLLLITGGVCLWIAETYKPTLSNQLGLNGNKFVLTPGTYHALMIAGIVFLVLGVVRLLFALSR